MRLVRRARQRNAGSAFLRHGASRLSKWNKSRGVASAWFAILPADVGLLAIRTGWLRLAHSDKTLNRKCKEKAYNRRLS